MAAFNPVCDWIQAVAVVMSLCAMRADVGELRGGHFVGDDIEVVHLSKVSGDIVLGVDTRRNIIFKEKNLKTFQYIIIAK